MLSHEFLGEFFNRANEKTTDNLSPLAALPPGCFCLPASTHAADGTALWTNVFSGLGFTDDEAQALAVDPFGDVIVTGHVYVGPYTTNGVTIYNHDYATVKYSSVGIPLWTNFFNGMGNGKDFANALAVDKGGNIYVTGYSTSIGGDQDYATIQVFPHRHAAMDKSLQRRGK